MNQTKPHHDIIGPGSAEGELLLDIRAGVEGRNADRPKTGENRTRCDEVAKPKPDRRLVTTTQEALTIWGEECAASGETHYGAKGLDRGTAMVGYSHETQVVILVQTTHGFASAYESLRRVHQEGKAPKDADIDALEAFSDALALRLPFRSIPKREPDCTADLPKETVPPARYDRR